MLALVRVSGLKYFYKTKEESNIMIWPFSKKQKNTKLPSMLIFNNGQDFFEYQCKFGQTGIQPERGIVALVLDASKEFDARDPVKIEDDGRQSVVLKVASEDGGFIVMAQTPTDKGDHLKPNDAVIWLPMTYAEEIVPEGTDTRFGWIGFVIAKIKPEIDMANPSFDTICDYT
jgi:hypothetical protein